LQITPPNAPRAVEEARAAAQRLADALPEDRQEIDRAKQAKIELERADRERQAGQMRRGEDATSDAAAITAASEQIGVAERRHSARQLALQVADSELGAAVQARSGEWARTNATAVERALRSVRKTSERLTGELQTLAEARSVQWWLANGMERQQPAPHAGLASLGTAKSSGFHMANSEPRGADQLLAWLGEIVDPEPEPQTPAEPVPSTAA
jgi:hypothetical protein